MLRSKFPVNPIPRIAGERTSPLNYKHASLHLIIWPVANATRRHERLAYSRPRDWRRRRRER